MLDPNGRREVIATLHELNRQEKITVLLITHYMEEVIDADRVIVMDDGKLVMDGTPREIFSRVKELKEYRLDVPQVTELAYELKQAGVNLPDGILTMDELMEKLSEIQKKYHLPMQSHLSENFSEIAWAEIPSPVPVNPRPSSVVAFTLT